METMTVGIEVERVWSDNDVLSKDGLVAFIPDPALGYDRFPREAVTLEGCLERVWSNTDLLEDALSPHTLKQAA